MIKSQLTWTKDKSRFAQFCHMIKVGKLVESHETLDDVVQKMAQVFGVDITTQYARNRISSLKFIDADKSMTPLIDELKEAVTTQINEQMEKTA